jgi:uncharacterized cupredoxin-like copper-binding protein
MADERRCDVKVGVVTIVGVLSIGAALLAAACAPAADGSVRQIVIEDMRFSPNRIDVKVGERIVLEVVNRGSQNHDLHFRSAHMPGMAGAQMIVAPGQTMRMNLRFDEPGTHVFSCSHPGHVGAMSGAVFVSP